MTYDYGHRSKPKLRGPARAAVAVGLLICLGIAGTVTGASLLNSRAHERVDQATYGPSGPPCPTGAPARLAAAGIRPRHSFEYGGLALSYAFGGADCAQIVGQGGVFGIGAPRVSVCRFTSPGGLGVGQGAGQRLFAPGLGKPAAIVKDRQGVRCVMTARELG
jgi:hypothetical protein